MLPRTTAQPIFSTAWGCLMTVAHRFRTLFGGLSTTKTRDGRFRAGRCQYRQGTNGTGIAVSGLSPYLHFGQISPLYIALQVGATSSRGKDAYLEELIVRRELSSNFVYYCHEYDSFECLPPWATRTLNYHARDKREYVYSREDFEAARTHDPYWNAAQKEMVLTGKMHGYMRIEPRLSCGRGRGSGLSGHPACLGRRLMHGSVYRCLP